MSLINYAVLCAQSLQGFCFGASHPFRPL